MIALSAGFVLASTIGTISGPPAQGGGYTSAGAPPAGVATTGARLAQSAATGVSTTNSLAVPKLLTVTTTSGTDVFNLNAIAAVGDYVETVTITFTAGAPQVAASQEYAITVFVAGGTSVPQLVFIETTTTFGSAAVDTVDFQYDLGSGAAPITITSVSDLITQCSAVGTC